VRLDHLVHVVQDREAAAEAARTALGLHVITGGEHPRWGTHNALAYFEDLSYIEFIAVRDPAVAEGSDFGAPILRFGAEGDGVGTVALRTTQIAEDVARLRARGIAIASPTEGSRRLPDGGLLTWRLALAPWPLPFLIEWGADDESRLADLRGRGALNGPGRRVETVFWAVRDLASGARWLGEGYGATLGRVYDHRELGAICLPSDCGITLCAPTGPGRVQERLERRGEGPVGYAIPNTPPQEFLGAWVGPAQPARGIMGLFRSFRI
jgi:hypothetical protein